METNNSEQLEIPVEVHNPVDYDECNDGCIGPYTRLVMDDYIALGEPTDYTAADYNAEEDSESYQNVYRED